MTDSRNGSSNWGRWGDDDQRGTLNFLSAEGLVAAAGLVRLGKVFELSIPIGQDGPNRGGQRWNAIHLMSLLPGERFPRDLLEVADDVISMPLQATTQWDSLAHVGYSGYFYNGVPTSEVTALGGAPRNGIDQLLPGPLGRGVLLDAARHRGVEWIEVGDPAITATELSEIAGAQGVEVGRSDIVLVRTGWRRKAVVDGWSAEWIDTNPGLHPDCAEWLASREVTAVASDNHSLEIVPMVDPDTVFPLHGALIRDLGMMIGEMFDLEELSADCAEDNRWDFFFCAPPLRVANAVGSPVSPVAIK
jgi:kynurenine formamidase